MPTESLPAIRADAISWHIRLRDGHSDDWDQFVDWLALDPQHSHAYDVVALSDGNLEQALVSWSSSRDTQANDNLPVIEATGSRRRWVVGGLSAVAAAAALMFATPLMRPTADFYEITTAGGQHRLVTLASRDSITLNGDTRIRLDRNNPRFASLAYGEAAFVVVHNPKAPFVLQLGDNRIEDAGTQFNVIRSPAGHTVEVAEGAILYNPEGERIALAAGQTLTSKTQEQRIILSRKPPAEVGGWQRGLLSYRASPLAIVAADISRNLGTPISVQPAIASRSFTGTIEIDRDESRMFARLAKLLDVDARRGANGWTLGPAQGAKS